MASPYRTIDPATGELVQTFETHDARHVEAALARAARASATWRDTAIERRAEALERVAARLDDDAQDLAALMALEMGKPIGEGAAEARKCAWGCRYYAERAPGFLAPERRESDGSEAWVRHEPLGPILAIMPWNFPFWQLYRFAAPALMAGNVVLLKHAPNTPQCALRIEQLMRECGLPEGALQNLFLTDEQAAGVIADPRVRGVTLTGSTRAGRQVAATAGRALKAMVLELGGSDPFIVLDDADLGAAVETGVASRCLNNGQSCIAAKRFIVQESAFDEFRDRFVAKMSARVMGHPAETGVELGPLARADVRDRLAAQVEASVAAGADLLTGGKRPERPGYYYPATVLAGVPAGSPAAEEELFGPVATLIRCESEEAALAIANASRYGLGASLWTSDPARAGRMVPRIEAGAVFVNGMVKSDPRLPFGGVKQSGFGRELGREGLLEFVNLKTVWIR